MAELVLYGLATCDTCRKALQYLGDRGRNPVFRDVRRDGLSQDFLARCAAAFGDALVNRRSTTWRNLGQQERDFGTADLIQQHPAVMKRPVIDDGTRLWLGWTDEVREGLG